MVIFSQSIKQETLLASKLIPNDFTSGGSKWFPWTGSGGNGGVKSVTAQSTLHWPDKPIVKLSDLPTGGRGLDDIIGSSKGTWSDISLRDTYTLGKLSGSLQNIPWYADWHTYLYLGAALMIGGVGLLGYNHYQLYGLYIPLVNNVPVANPNAQIIDLHGYWDSLVNLIPAIPFNWSIPAIPITSLNPRSLLRVVAQKLVNYNNNLTTTEANEQLNTLHDQNSRKIFDETKYPFTNTPNNDSLALKINRYWFGESVENRQERARCIATLNEEIGINMDDRSNPLTAGVYEKIYKCTGFRLKTASEMLHRKLYNLTETPCVSPHDKVVDLPPQQPVASGSGTHNAPLSEDALLAHNEKEGLFNKPLGPLSSGSQADMDAAKEAFGGLAEFSEDEGDDDDNEAVSNFVNQNTPTPASKGKNVVRTAKLGVTAALNIAKSVIGLEPDDDLSATLRPPITVNNETLPSAADDDPTTPTPTGRAAKPKRPLGVSPLHRVKRARGVVGLEHTSAEEAL